MFSVEGVLAEERSVNLAECPATDTGRILYSALSSQYESVVVSLIHSREAVEMWVQREGFAKVLRIFTPDDFVKQTMDETQQAEDIFRDARVTGHDLQVVVSASPAVAIAAHRSGIHAYLSLSPIYGRAEWRPDFVGSPQPWDQLVADVEETRALHMADTRRVVRE